MRLSGVRRNDSLSLLNFSVCNRKIYAVYILVQINNPLKNNSVNFKSQGVIHLHKLIGSLETYFLKLY